MTEGRQFQMSDPGGLPPGSVNSVATPEEKLPTGKGVASAAPDATRQISPATIAVGTARRVIRAVPPASRRTRIVDLQINSGRGVVSLGHRTRRLRFQTGVLVAVVEHRLSGSGTPEAPADRAPTIPRGLSADPAVG